MSDPNFILRPMKPEDAKFILSSWKRSWRVSPWAGTVRNDQVFDVVHSTIEGLVTRGARFTVAVHPATDRILGWACTERLGDGTACVHYVYVKDAYVPLQIGKELVEQAPGTKPGLYTHRHRQVVDACPGWRHAPEVARRK